MAAAAKPTTKTVLIFYGEYDLGCKAHLRSVLDRLTDVEHAVLDFTDVTYMDSTVVVELLRMHQISNAKGYDREPIVGQSQNLTSLFALMSLQDVFHSVPDMGHVLEKPGERIGLIYTSGLAEQPCGGHFQPGRGEAQPLGVAAL